MLCMKSILCEILYRIELVCLLFIVNMGIARSRSEAADEKKKRKELVKAERRVNTKNPNLLLLQSYSLCTLFFFFFFFVKIVVSFVIQARRTEKKSHKRAFAREHTKQTKIVLRRENDHVSAMHLE